MNFELYHPLQIIGCISVLLRAQEYASWSAGLTLKLFNQVLSYVTHTKPNIRKAAQRAIESVIHGSCFMRPSIQTEQDAEHVTETSKVSFHPAGTYVAKFCIEQFKLENLTKSQTVILYTIELMKKTLHGLKNDDIKEMCEYLLSIMVTSKTNVQKNCFDVLDHLFQSKSPNLTQDLIGKLIAAVYNYRPEQSDVHLILAWVNVMKRGHVCFTLFNVTKSLLELPRFVDILANDIWKSDNLQIATGVYHTLKELFEECVTPGLETDALVNLHRRPITRMINEIAKCLNEPYGFVSQQVIGVFQTIFEVCGRHFGDILQPALNQIASRYDTTASKQVQIENAVRAAITTMGPQAALTAVPLTDATGEVNIARLWVLQALKKAVTGSKLQYFEEKILKLAEECREKWEKHQKEGNLAAARTNELFYIQLWDLFPSFCDQPIDPARFGTIAKSLGLALKNQVEIRVAIFDGLLKLLQNPDETLREKLGKFAKNFLNRLFIIYESKPSGTEEHISRTNAMKLIVEFLKITPTETLTELYTNVRKEFKAKERVENVLQKVQELNQTVDRSDEDNVQIGSIEADKIQKAHDLLKKIIENYEMEYIDGNTGEVSELIRIIPAKRIQKLFTKFVDKYKYQAYFDMLIMLAAYQRAQQLDELFVEYIEPTLRNAKSGGITPLIKERQSKSYQLLQSILESDSNDCKHFVRKNRMEIQKALLNTLQNRKDSAQDARLT